MYNHPESIVSSQTEEQIWPDFILGGAQKCGTSSLAIWLDSHPGLICSKPKEPDVFSNRQKALSGTGYRQYFPELAGAAGAYFEASTGYFTDPEAARLMHQVLGKNIKLIFILRDPVQRAISAYWHMFKHNAEKRSAEEVFASMPDGADDVYVHENQKILEAHKRGLIDNRRQMRYDDHFLQFRYVHNSLYSKHYKVYEQYFGRENILLLNLDTLHGNPTGFFKKITDFVGVDPYAEIPDTRQVYNRTRIPRYFLNPVIRQNKNLAGFFTFLRACASKVNMGSLFTVEAPDLPGRIQDHLTDILSTEQAFLESLENR